MRIIRTDALRLDGSADRASYIPGVFNIGQMHDRRVTEPRKLEGIDIVIVDTCGEVAVDFSEKRATTTREQLRRVHGVFDRVTLWHTAERA